jgi:predicted glycoside hydrolase/deacetylase ChbG (UPF0249 family)
MDKRVIINADDFGLCDGVNKAVAQAHTDGVLTSATIMANMPAAEEAVKIAKKLPNLGVGVHLNLFDGQPVSKDSSIDCLLNADGRFALSQFKLSLLSTGRHNNSGLAPTHLDSHKHIHSFPAIFPIVCELARRFRIAAVRFTFEPKELSRMPWPLSSTDGRKRARKARRRAKINRIQNSDFLKTDALLGIAHMGKIDVNLFKAVSLYNSAATAEVMTHPGLAGDSETGESRLPYQRKAELEALCSERTRQYFRDAQIKLVHYGQI